MKHENYDPYFPDQPVVDLYLTTWAKLPAFKSKQAFIWVEDDGDRSNRSGHITYEELNTSVQCISLRLLGSLKRGDTVVVLCSPGLELVEIIFACQRAGLLVVPVSPPDPSFSGENFHHLVRVLSQTNPKAAIAESEYIKSVRQYISAPSSNTRLSKLLKELKWIPMEEIRNNNAHTMCEIRKGDECLYNGCRAEEVYLIQYTSGATGIPKPVLVTAGAAAHNVRTARKAYDLHPNSVIVSWLPQYHDCGLMFLLLTVVSGATCVLTSPNAFVRRPRIWLEIISDYKATCTPVPSFALPLVLRRGRVDQRAGSVTSIDLLCMKNLIVINEPIYRSAIQEFVEMFKPYGLDPSAISPSYGLAENCTFVSTAWRVNGNGNGGVCDFPTYNQLLPSAKLPTNGEEEEEIEILVVDEETEAVVDDGTEGEIWVSSPSNASGYLHHPSLTRQVFHARARFRNNVIRQCFVRTGDRGVVNGEERYLYVTGRCSNAIKLPNRPPIHPHYIETAAYNACPHLLRGGCLAAFEFSTTIALVAELQRTDVGLDALGKACEAMREAAMNKENGLSAPVGIVVLVKSGSVPKTTSGKVQRWLAKHKLEKGMMAVITQVNFHDHGGHLKKNMGRKESIKAPFMAPTSNL
nr:disco-interacting protein 2 homolog A-like [Ipomoea batatas]GME06128.1 disco-interacting protein 2 homolog A-like [Ipomoea batatas]